MTNNDRYIRIKRPERLYPLFARLGSLPGIGERLEKLLNKKTGDYVIDLLRHLPIAIIDRTRRPPINEIEHGEVVTIEATVIKHDRPPKQSRRPWRVFAENETGQVELVYFRSRGDYVERLLPIGAKRIISGRAEWYQNKVQINHPDHVVAPKDIEQLPRYEPVYSMTLGLTAKQMNRAIMGAMKSVPKLPEWIPPRTISLLGWGAWDASVRAAHTPKNAQDLMPESKPRARLAYDELLANQLALALVRKNTSRDKGRIFAGNGELRRALLGHLPFDLTQAQERVIKEILTDQKEPHRMLRLLQGDVGAGKTLVALIAMLNVIEDGAQASIMAPTELLARQHHASINKMLEPLGIKSHLLVGKLKAGERRAAIEGLADGTISMIVGTHSLLSDDVQFHNLGLAVVDEQHRFGVRQRLILGEKSRDLDVLVMTATPIPRTLAMTAFGDLDVSILDEKPIGRPPIITSALPIGRIDAVVERLKVALASGKQAYWICPLVDESEVLDLTPAEDRFAMLKAAMPNIDIDLVHGRMKADIRDEAMERFRQGAVRLLVATTVVEVGVDVPHASIMIIEHAERFGLSQMHQLRGRVGRGLEESSCLLLYKPPLGAIARARVAVMKQSNDGFKIAEEDLRLRGPGEILGQKQSGDPNFVLADLAHHGELLNLARDQALEIVERNPELSGSEGEALKILLALFERDLAVTYLAGG